jgi:L-ascorbate metabolism protein UlaG (beta-lactamase superfamily)
MRLTLIRNATLRLSYGGHMLLVDPFLAPQHSLPSFAGKSPNPLVDLPVPAGEVLAGAELVIISHLHGDHFDPLAQQQLPKTLPLICQPENEERIRGFGFTHVTPLVGQVRWDGLKFSYVGGEHGSGEVLAGMGPVMGFVLRADGEPSIYWAGDTVLIPEVRDAIARERPDVIVTHSCGAVWNTDTLIVMDAAQTVEVCQLAPWATVVAAHMEALDHATVTRQELRQAAEDAGITATQLLIPDDGETLVLGSPPQ